MPPVLAPVSYEPIRAVRVLSSQGNSPQLTRVPEAATQTFQIGVPTALSSGFIAEWVAGPSNIVYGVSSEKAHNYAVAGVPVDLNEPAAGPPPNQPAAIVIPLGAAPRDGNTGVYGANGQTVFSIALKLGQTFNQGLLVPPTTLYGLTKDATSGFWFLDTTVTGGNSGVAVLLGVDPSSPNDAVFGTRVFFIFAETRRFFQ